MISNNTSTAPNVTSIDPQEIPYSQGETVAIVVAMVVTFLIALAGNTVVIRVILKVRSMQTATNLLLLNLSVADLVIATLNLPFKTVDMYITHYWPFGDFVCRIYAFSQIMAFFVSILSLVAVAYERYTTICKPKLLRRFVCTTRRVKYVIGAIWLVGVAGASPMLKFFQNTPWPCFDGTGMCTFCASTGWTMDALKVYTVVVFFLFFIFPLCIMTFAYLSIGRTVWQTAQNTSAMRRNRDSERATKSRITKISLAMLFSFVIAWGPGLGKRMHAFLSSSSGGLDSETSLVLHTVFHWFQYSNCALNPVLYSFMSDRFKQAFGQVFRRDSLRSIKCKSSKHYIARKRSNCSTKQMIISKDGQQSYSKNSDDTMRTYNRSGSSAASGRNTLSQEQDTSNMQQKSKIEGALLSYETAI